ncbi:hypothetical protein HYX13_00060 [Candidatus Woesearchaeota archaeon]|nr:hypothetical protein [Candidatus Woesearchaeota archaeon]
MHELNGRLALTNGKRRLHRELRLLSITSFVRKKIKLSTKQTNNSMQAMAVPHSPSDAGGGVFPKITHKIDSAQVD